MILVLIIVHLLELLGALLLAFLCKENQWKLFFALSVIPIIGPALIIIAYILDRAQKQLDSKNNV